MDVKEVTISAEYLDYTDVFSLDSAAKLPKHTRINDYPIDLIDDKQLPYGPIYNLGLVKLKTMKTYIKTNLANSFIRPSKLPAGTPILFIRKKDGSLQVCIDYQGLNNLIIKNWYLLPLISKSLNRLGHTKFFTQLNLINAYH